MSKVEFTSGNWNPANSISEFSSTAQNVADRMMGRTNSGIASGLGGMSKRHYQRASALMQQHHNNVMEYTTANYSHEAQLQSHLSGLREQEAQGAHSREKEFQSHIAGLKEQEAQGTHGRNKDLLKTIQTSSKGGTQVNVGFPTGGTVSYVRNERAPKKAAQTAPTNPVYSPVKMSEEPQIEPPAPSAPSSPAAKTQKYAHRDPQTKKIIGYKDYPQEPLKPNVKKKAAPKKKKR